MCDFCDFNPFQVETFKSMVTDQKAAEEEKRAK